jgi:hypothetical protein
MAQRTSASKPHGRTGRCGYDPWYSFGAKRVTSSSEQSGMLGSPGIGRRSRRATKDSPLFHEATKPTAQIQKKLSAKKSRRKFSLRTMAVEPMRSNVAQGRP